MNLYNQSIAPQRAASNNLGLEQKSCDSNMMNSALARVDSAGSLKLNFCYNKIMMHQRQKS